MIKVLAAEMSDQQRMSRGKRYHADDAVVDIVIGHGSVTAEVQGGRPEPYIVTIEADGGSGVPKRSELWIRCTCPDDDGSGSHLCKHGVAAMFSLSDEVSIDPELVDRWRASRRRSADAQVTDLDSRRRDPTGPAHGRERDRPADVIRLPSPASTEQTVPDRDPDLDLIAGLLGAPAGAAPPEFPDVDEIDHRSLPDPMVRGVLDDALDHLHLRWE
jgi:uncharacterized Zn finger protein